MLRELCETPGNGTQHPFRKRILVKLGEESSCVTECHKSYCSDGQLFLLDITLSCNIILIYSLKKRSYSNAVEGAGE